VCIDILRINIRGLEGDWCRCDGVVRLVVGRCCCSESKLGKVLVGLILSYRDFLLSSTSTLVPSRDEKGREKFLMQINFDGIL